MSASSGQGRKINSVSHHGFIDTTRANTSHERAEQIRVCDGSTPAYKGVAGVREVCALTEKMACASAASTWHRARSSRQPVHLNMYFCFCLQSDGLLDMFAQEGVYCSRFGKAGIDREISKRGPLR
ncbi:MAG: hypothetical protein ACI3XF_07080 [Eubacteriales bacterium]